MKGLKLPIFVITLGASAVVHVGVVYPWAEVVHVSAGDLGDGTGHVRGSGRTGPATISLTFTDDGLLETPPTEPKDPAKPDPAAPPPEPAKPDLILEPPKPLEKLVDEVGDRKGKGTASHDAKGDRILLARKADNDQPFLDRDPRGPAEPREPSHSVVPEGQGGRAGGAGGKPAPPIELIAPPPTPPAMQQPPERAAEGEHRPGPVEVKVPSAENGVDTGVTEIDPAAKMIGPLAPAVAGTDPRVRSAERTPAGEVRPDGFLPPMPAARVAVSPPPAPFTLRMPKVPAPTPEMPAVPAPPVAVAAAPSAQPGDGGQPGVPVPPAGKAQESDSEVDAFNQIESVLRRDGSMEVRPGRKVKTRRPNLLIPGQIDAALGSRTVTMKVRVNPDGTVANVTVSKSSGSNEVDQPCLVSMYDWWFEPRLDTAGKPVPDTIFFTINFR